MIKVYAMSLAVGVAGLVVFILGGAFAENVGRPELAPGERWGLKGKTAVGAATAFGMGGMSAEFSPFDFEWPVSLLLALAAAALAAYWVRYASARANR